MNLILCCLWMKTKKTSLYVLLLRLDRRGRRGGTRRNTPTMDRTWHERRTKKRQSKYWGKRWRGVGQGAGCTRSICLKFLLLRKGFLEKGKTATRRPWALQRGAVGPRTLCNTTQGGAWSRAAVVGARTRAGTGVRVTLTCLQLYFLRVRARVHTFFFSARGGVLN